MRRLYRAWQAWLLERRLGLCHKHKTEARCCEWGCYCAECDEEKINRAMLKREQMVKRLASLYGDSGVRHGG